MNNYNVIYPVCGAVNYNLYLEETDGWMECESCGCAVNLKNSAKMVFPVFKEQQTEKISSDQFAEAKVVI